MSRSRTLRLHRDSLVELTPDELRGAVAAAPTLFCTSALTHCDPVCEALATLTDPA